MSRHSRCGDAAQSQGSDFPDFATKGAGVEEWADWLRAKIETFRA
ncbi:MAG: hypothetical protein ACLTQI_04255 [Slackia sp.]